MAPKAAKRAEFATATWCEGDINIGVRKALCSDGVRRYARLTGEPDTWFSIPASVKVQGKTVTGFVSMAEEDVHFTANVNGKNANLLLGRVGRE